MDPSLALVAPGGNIAVSLRIDKNYIMIEGGGCFEISTTFHREEKEAGSLRFYPARIFLYAVGAGLSISI